MSEGNINPFTGACVIHDTDKLVAAEANDIKCQNTQHFIAKTEQDFRLLQAIERNNRDHAIETARITQEVLLSQERTLAKIVEENNKTRELFLREKIEDQRFEKLVERLTDSVRGHPRTL
jgi:hypothetical protein